MRGALEYMGSNVRKNTKRFKVGAHWYNDLQIAIKALLLITGFDKFQIFYCSM